MFAENHFFLLNDLNPQSLKGTKVRSFLIPEEVKEVRSLTVKKKKNYIQSKTVAIYMCQTPTGPEGEDLSTCHGVKGPWDQHSGRMNEVLSLTPRDLS